jgi:hypothetical protein
MSSALPDPDVARLADLTQTLYVHSDSLAEWYTHLRAIDSVLHRLLERARHDEHVRRLHEAIAEHRGN